ncbi:DNM3B methyltransferase, partial [Acromyrmex charruanus]
MIANVWALSCALDLGLLCESSLKEVVIASCSELDFPSTTEDAGKSSERTNDHEDDATKSANIFGNSWPFIDPTQIKQITSTKPAQRKRRRKVRLSLKRYKKPRIVYSKINDAIVDLAIENDTSLSLQGSEQENLDVSHDRSARLSARENSSSTRSRVFVRDEDERLSGSSESSEDEEEVISQTSSEIAPVDYSGSGYSKFYSQSHAKEDPQNREELSEYPDYFMNVLRIDNSIENNDLDTSEDVTSIADTSKDDDEPLLVKYAKFSERRATRKSLENENVSRKTRGINPKDTAAAIMRDIQECISTKIAKDDENIEETISKNGRDMLEKSNHKDPSQDVSMEYEWVVKNEFKDQDQSFQKFERSTNVEESLINVNPVGRRRKKRYRYSIDCKQDENTETAYRSVFHDCVDFDTPRSAPSLKINMEEIWKSEDSSDNDNRIHSSWRRSTLESSTEECGNEVIDSAMLLAMKIVSDDSIKDEKCDDKDETLNNACLKYHEKSDIFPMKINSFDDSNEAMEDIKFMGQRDEAIITYTNKNRTIRRSASDGNFAKDEDNDSKDQGAAAKNMKINSKVNVMRQCSRNKGNNLKYDDEKSESGPRRVTRALVKTKNINENHPGKLVWGFFSGWWPALIVDAEHVGMAPEPDKLWVFWIGESQISLLKPETQIQPFSRNLEERLSQPSRKNIRSRAIDATIQILRQRFNCTLTKPYYYWIRRNIANLETLDDLTFHPYPENIQEKLDGLKEKNSKATKKFMSRRKSSPEPPPKKQNTEKNKNVNTSWEQIDDERLCLQSQQPGVIAWAKIPGHCWWPAMIVDYRDCCLKEPSFGCQWIMWYGDYQVSEVRHLEFLKFHKGIEKMREYIQNTNRLPYLEGVLQASKDYCSRLGCDTDNWTLDNVFEYFSNNIHIPSNQLQVSDSNRIYDKYSKEMVKKINEFKFKSDIGAERKRDIKASNDFRRIVSGDCDLENLCLKCLKIPKGRKEEHPFFVGSLCKKCSDEFKPCMFVHGNDGKCFYCTICANTGTVLICDSEDCPRVYCTACLKFLICPKSFDDMLLEDPWECFLCRDKTKQPKDLILRPRLNWKEHFTKMFRTTPNFTNDVDIANLKKQNKAVRVLSLFDGLSTGFLVLQKLGLVVDVYYASEIDVNALTISSAHFGDRITYLGDVRGITKEKIQEIAPIDLLIGGSPCNDLSLVNPARLGLHDPKGTGILFFEYCRIKKLVEKANKDRHMFWLFENVASMPTEYRLEINKNLGREPDVIDSADFSPQHRLRLYWHNLPFNPYMPLFESRQDVQDKLTPNLNRKALCKKLHTVTGRTGSLLQGIKISIIKTFTDIFIESNVYLISIFILGKAELKPIIMKGKTDTIWITELEEIFGFPRHYTDVKNLSATNRQKILGKSWSVQTLIAILRPLCLYFKCNEDETNKKSVS